MSDCILNKNIIIIIIIIFIHFHLIEIRWQTALENREWWKRDVK